jgi:hypothetical protein
MKDLMEMLMKKKGQPQKVDATEKMAKMQAVKELISMLEEMMGEDVEGGMMKKVTVAAPDEKSLEMGLEKAKDVVSEMPEMEDEEDEDYE